jgi:decaprenylphospho-beta-D-ribofuranose 2-oxidase
VHEPRDADEVAAVLARAGARGAIARGLGRSYGDAAQCAGGDVLATGGLDRILALDLQAGTATVEAGVSLADLTRVTLPLGWLAGTTPGTQHVTVGGAIACDVHGKNHHRDGGFGGTLLAGTLLPPAGGPLALTPQTTPDELAATIGGLGLTGVLLDATLRLRPVETAWMRVRTERGRNLEHLLALLAAADAASRYTVAWIDLVAGGRERGRGILDQGDHATVAELGRRLAAHPLQAPRRRELPAPLPTPALFHRPSLRVFNEAWFRVQGRERSAALVPLSSFFHPLDGVRGWNRLYGRAGFVQYQLVVPDGRADVVETVVERLIASRCPVSLAVLKRLGAGAGLLSFPVPGLTLALDVRAGWPPLAALLDELDGLVADAGGRVYLAKDARLRPGLVRRMYPELDRFRSIRDRLDPARVMRSDLARRLSLVEDAGA